MVPTSTLNTQVSIEEAEEAKAESLVILRLAMRPRGTGRLALAGGEHIAELIAQTAHRRAQGCEQGAHYRELMTTQRRAQMVGLTGRQVAGAFAALGLAIGIFWPVPNPHAEANGSGTACPLGYGGEKPAATTKTTARDPHAAWFRRYGGGLNARVYTNASFWTGDAGVPWVQAIAVTEAGRVLAIGNLPTVLRAAGPDAPVHHLGGENGDFVVPGLFDTHLHLVSGGFRLAELNLADVKTRDEFVARVAAAAKGLDADQWLVGGGYGSELHDDPTAEWFDHPSIPKTLKAWLLRADAHTGVASREALRVSGIDASTPDPDGGFIVREPADGKTPNGILRDNAIGLVTAARPAKSENERREAFKRAFDHLLSVGVTSVCDFGDVDHLAGSHVTGAAERVWKDLDILRAMDDAGELPIRVSHYPPLADWERVAEIDFRDRMFRDVKSDDARYETYGDRTRLRLAGVKAFLDGSLGARTALMREPYEDDGDNKGVAVCDLDEFKKRAVAADAANLQVAVHAIGDAAVDVALDAAEAMKDLNGNRDRRFRIEHTQHLGAPIESQPKRIAMAGAVSSVQPEFMRLDRNLAVKRLGRDRAARSYAFRSLLASGVPLSGGSDWPIVDADPLAAMDVAVSRNVGGDDFDDSADGVWEASEKLTPQQALTMYTTGAAHVALMSGQVGTLWRGAHADFTVLDRSPEDLGSTKPPKVVSTFVAGKCAWGRCKRD